MSTVPEDTKVLICYKIIIHIIQHYLLVNRERNARIQKAYINHALCFIQLKEQYHEKSVGFFFIAHNTSSSVFFDSNTHCI